MQQAASCAGRNLQPHLDGAPNQWRAADAPLPPAPLQPENKFKCPCHGSQYNAQGKKIRGPAPLVGCRCRLWCPAPPCLAVRRGGDPGAQQGGLSASRAPASSSRV
jgi:hypothetical protein